MERSRIGGLLRARRNQLRLTLQNVADAVDMSKGAIGHMETGQNSTTTDTLLRVAEALEARWIVRLVAADAAGRDPLRTELVDRLDRLVDQLDEPAVRVLLATLEVYEGVVRARQGQTKT